MTDLKKYYTYVLRCEDGSVYTGITTDLKRRFAEHSEKNGLGARYTRSHTAIKLEAAWESDSRSLASKLEYRIKHLKKEKKERLISGESISIVGDEFSEELYRRVDISSS